MKKIHFIPEKHPENKYIDLMKESFFEAGFEETKLKKSEFVSLNWFEVIYKKDFLRATKNFTLKFLKLLYIIGARKKILWTYHNRKPHVKNFELYHKILLLLILKNSSFIIIHSRNSKELLLIDYPFIDNKKIIYIPHPSYSSSYKLEYNYNEYNENQRLKLLFFGVVSPYKNVDVLIDAFENLNNKSLELNICGNCSDLDFKKKILEKKYNSNISFDLRFIKDSELPTLIGESDVLITPYNNDSMLNSGTHILAFSLGKTVISTHIVALNDIPKNLWVEIPDVSSDKDLLENKLLKIFQNYSKEDFKIMGKKLRNYILENNSINKISETIREEIQ